MKLRLTSDVHSEFFDLHEIKDEALKILPEMDGDKETVLVLAGDIGSMHKPANLAAFIDEVAPRFHRVFYIPGNHEYYGGNIKSTPDVIEALVCDHGNLSFGALRSWERLHMATLWTDFDNGNPLSIEEAYRRMNDYRMIRNGNRTAIPTDMLQIHGATVEHFKTFINPGDIVITHHMPSHQSVPEEYKHERVNGAYASNLEGLILDRKPQLWMHGHTHDACDYMIGETRVLCNPRGYGNQHKKNGYNPRLVVEISNEKIKKD